MGARGIVSGGYAARLPLESREEASRVFVQAEPRRSRTFRSASLAKREHRWEGSWVSRGVEHLHHRADPRVRGTASRARSTGYSVPPQRPQ